MYNSMSSALGAFDPFKYRKTWLIRPPSDSCSYPQIDNPPPPKSAYETDKPWGLYAECYGMLIYILNKYN